MPTPLVVEISRLQKLSDTRNVLDIEHWTVQAGQAVAIVGPVGSGKGELLSLLVGLALPTTGEVRVCGLDPYRERQRISQSIGVVFREAGLYERQSARENLVFQCGLRGLPARRADEVLAEVGLADQSKTPAGKLPPNLARRLAYGRALLHNPRVLFLMEPFAGCDTVSCELLSASIRRQVAHGHAALILTREGGGLANLCGEVWALDRGCLNRVEMPQDGNRTSLPFRIPARQEGQVVLVNPADLLYAVADEDQTRLHTLQGLEIPSHLNMSELEARLGRNGFFRAHRSYLVNLQRVYSIIPYTRDSYTLILDDAARTEIPLSKNAAKELRDLLGY
ncbi:MAG: LytTR family transcriptional regulator DNA-binding domain-containing protein [Chloroflexota bacterium]